MLNKNTLRPVKPANLFDEPHFKFDNLCDRLSLIKIIRDRGDDYFVKNALRIHKISNEIAKFESDESTTTSNENAAPPFETFSPG